MTIDEERIKDILKRSPEEIQKQHWEIREFGPRCCDDWILLWAFSRGYISTQDYLPIPTEIK